MQTITVSPTSGIDPSLLANIIRHELVLAFDNTMLHRIAGSFDHNNKQYEVYHIDTAVGKATAVLTKDGALVCLKPGRLQVENVRAGIAQSDDATC